MYVGNHHREPNYRLRGLLVIAAIIAMYVIVYFVAAPSGGSDCLINGYGNKLCGDDAMALCDLQWERTLYDESYDACVSIDWTE